MSRPLGQHQAQGAGLQSVEGVQGDVLPLPAARPQRVRTAAQSREQLAARSTNSAARARFRRRARARSYLALYQASKRAFDIVVGSMLLLIALPVVIAAAAWIRADSEGSPFFFQTRLGRDGKPFRIFKLRGMYIDSRQRFPELYDYSHNRDLNFHFHYNSDPRVTRAGKFCRRTSIDELPNLWNVVVGDMSLVGPRPEIPEILEMYGSFRDEYLSVKPGITCRSKVTGRDELTKRESLEFDVRYIRNQGFAEDFSILCKTLLNVLSRRDVY